MYLSPEEEGHGHEEGVLAGGEGEEGAGVGAGVPWRQIPGQVETAAASAAHSGNT